jgi:hypothetical protein
MALSAAPPHVLAIAVLLGGTRCEATLQHADHRNYAGAAMLTDDWDQLYSVMEVIVPSS